MRSKQRCNCVQNFLTENASLVRSRSPTESCSGCDPARSPLRSELVPSPALKLKSSDERLRSDACNLISHQRVHQSFTHVLDKSALIEPVYSLTPLHMLIRIPANTQTPESMIPRQTRTESGQQCDLNLSSLLRAFDAEFPFISMTSRAAQRLAGSSAEETCIHIKFDFLKSNHLHSMAPKTCLKT